MSSCRTGSYNTIHNEESIKGFAKSLIENILEQTIKEHLRLNKYKTSQSKIDQLIGQPYLAGVSPND